MKSLKFQFMGRLAVVFGLLAAAGSSPAQDILYKQPPKSVLEALRALPSPGISVSQQRDYAIITQAVRYPSISEVAQPMLRLAGIRIDTNTNGMHQAANFLSFSIRRLSDGAEIKVSPVPRDAKLGPPIWSPDGKQFAFTNTTGTGIELWVATTETGQAHRLEGVKVNGVVVGGGGRNAESRAIEWMGDNKTLLVHLVPAGRGPAPAGGVALGTAKASRLRPAAGERACDRQPAAERGMRHDDRRGARRARLVGAHARAGACAQQTAAARARHRPLARGARGRARHRHLGAL